MHLKNLNIILAFIVIALAVSASPISVESSDKKIKKVCLVKKSTNMDSTETNVPVSDFDKDLTDLFNWSNYSGAFVNKMTNDLLEHFADTLRTVEAIPNEQSCFENVIAPLEYELYNKLSSVKLTLDVIQNSYPDVEVRDAAADAYLKISDYEIDNYKNNEKLYQKIVKVTENIENGICEAPKEHEDQVLLKRLNKEFLSFSLNLSEEDSAELMKLEKRLSEITNEFNRCLNEGKK